MTGEPSSPETYERLQAAMRRHAADPGEGSLHEVSHAVWDAYPLTDRERVQLRGWGLGDWVENFDAHQAACGREGTG